MKKWTALLLLVCLLVSLSVFGLKGTENNQTPTKHSGEKFRIAYTESSPYSSYAAHLYGILVGLKEMGWIRSLEGIPYKAGQDDTAAMWQWLIKNQPSDYLQFVPNGYYSLNGDAIQTQTVYTRIHGGPHDIDLMLVMGTMAGRSLAVQKPDVPVLIFSTSNAIASQIIGSATDSGKDNVWAHVDLKRYRKQVQVLHDIFHFKKLGIVYDDTLEGRSYADLDNVQAVCGQLGVELVRRTVTENKNEADYSRYRSDMQKAFTDLSDKVDAFYLTAGNLKPQELSDLLKPFYSKKVPVFSQLGGEEVQYGALISTAANYMDIGRFGAQVIARSLHGENPRRIPATYEDTPKIVLNLDVARKIGYKPDFEILLIADKLYLSQKGAKP